MKSEMYLGSLILRANQNFTNSTSSDFYRQYVKGFRVGNNPLQRDIDVESVVRWLVGLNDGILKKASPLGKKERKELFAIFPSLKDWLSYTEGIPAGPDPSDEPYFIVPFLLGVIVGLIIALWIG